MEQVITIFKDVWEHKPDGLWYAHVPTVIECDENTDTVMSLADDEEFIEEHEEVFSALNNGITTKNEVTISCDIKPDIDIKVTIQTLEQAGGRIVYDKDGNPEYLPENNGLGLLGALGGLNMAPDINTIVDALGTPLKSDEE